MNLLNNLRWVSGAFLGSLNWVPTAARTITLPDSSGTIQLNGTPTTVYRSIVAVTATKTLALADLGTYQYCTNTTGTVITIPLESSVAFPLGAEIEMKKGGTAPLSIAIATGVTLLGDGGASAATPMGLTRGASIKKVATNSWIVEGS